MQVHSSTTASALAQQKRPEHAADQQAARPAARDARISDDDNSRLSTSSTAAAERRSVQAKLDAMKAEDAQAASAGKSPTVDGLMQAWGTDHPDFDLNGDGVVDGKDLGMLLAGMTDPDEGANANQAATELKPSNNEGPQNQPAPLPTIDELMAAWGSDNPDFDLNGDGVVDGKDLGILLASMSEPYKGDETADPSYPGENGSMPTIDELMAAWGSDNPDFDLNGDGVVDGKDLGILLASMGMPPGDEDGEPAEDLPPAVQAALEDVENVTLSDDAQTSEPGDPKPMADAADKITQTILSALGAEDQRRIDAASFNGPPSLLDSLDADGNGWINVSDLNSRIEASLERAAESNPDFKLSGMVQRWTGMFSGETPPPAGETAHAAQSDSAEAEIARSDDARLEQIADNVKDHLSELGFDDTPPTDLRELVDQMELASADRQALMGKLAARYPQGLGLNAIG